MALIELSVINAYIIPMTIMNFEAKISIDIFSANLIRNQNVIQWLRMDHTLGA